MAPGFSPISPWFASAEAVINPSERDSVEASSRLLDLAAQGFDAGRSAFNKIPPAARQLASMSGPALHFTTGVFSVSAAAFRRTGAALAQACPLPIETFLDQGLIKLNGNILIEVQGAKSEEELKEVARGLAVHWPWALKMAADGDKIPPFRVVLRDRNDRDIGNASTGYGLNGVVLSLFREVGGKIPNLAHMVNHEFSHVVDLLLFQLIKSKFNPESWSDNQGKPLDLSSQHFSKRASDNYYAQFPSERGGKYRFNGKGILGNLIGKYWFQEVAAPLFLSPQEREDFKQALIFRKPELKRYYDKIYTQKYAITSRFGQESLVPDLQPGAEAILMSGKDDQGKRFEYTDTFRVPHEFFVTVLSSYLANELTPAQAGHYQGLLVFFDRLRFSDGDPEKIWRACEDLHAFLDGVTVG